MYLYNAVYIVLLSQCQHFVFQSSETTTLLFTQGHHNHSILKANFIWSLIFAYLNKNAKIVEIYIPPNAI